MLRARLNEAAGTDPKLLRNLDSWQRRTLTLFALFGYKPRNAALLCQRWVEEGFVETADPAQKSRRCKLSDTYIPVVDEID
jgi:hypothetical protein